MEEIWKTSEVKDIYVSNLGNINSGYKKYYEFCFNGYKAIQVFNKIYYVHRLVGKAFIPNPERKPCINHKDGNKLNNCVDNLEWVTYSENNKHAYEKGLKKPAKETNKHKSICMLNDKKEIMCVFLKSKYVNEIFKKDMKGNVIRAIKTNTKCNGYYWEYYYDNDINLKIK